MGQLDYKSVGVVQAVGDGAAWLAAGLEAKGLSKSRRLPSSSTTRALNSPGLGDHPVSK